MTNAGGHGWAESGRAGTLEDGDLRGETKRETARNPDLNKKIFCPSEPPLCNIINKALWKLQTPRTSN